MRRNSPTILLLYALTVSICLQMALNWPEVMSLSDSLLASWSSDTVTTTAQIAAITLAAPADQGKHVVVLLNGVACGTLTNGSLQVAVRDGDVVELDGYSRDTVVVTVISTGRRVLLPVPGQAGSVQNSRSVLARVLLRK